MHLGREPNDINDKKYLHRYKIYAQENTHWLKTTYNIALKTVTIPE